jgi:hypothetical protein
MNILNYTPHDINLYDETGENIIQTFPRTGKQIRLISGHQDMVNIGLKFPVVECQTFTGIEPFDVPENVHYLLVSMPVGEYYKNSAHCQYCILGPDTGPQGVVRDDSGRIVGTKRLVLYRMAD